MNPKYRTRVTVAFVAVLTLSVCSPPSGSDHDGGRDASLADVSPGDGDVDDARDAGSDVDLDMSDSMDTDADDDGVPARECVPEVCNDGLDNDCNGWVDEACPCEPGSIAPCFPGDPRHREQGLCHDGAMLCTGTYEFGEWGPCEGAVTAQDEVCDVAALDEDCDGAPNDGCDCVEGDPDIPCGSDVGACEQGTQRCAAGLWTECEGAVVPSIETCNGIDDDCDGLTDEGCDCVAADRRLCGTDVGLCETGHEICDERGRWGVCEGGVGPAVESCNLQDDDCDGAIDEGDVCPRFPPTLTCPASVTVRVGDPAVLIGGGEDPDGGEVTFAWSVSSAPLGSAATPMPGDTAAATITPDAPGTYVLRFCVTDDEGVTRCCTVTVTAEPRCVPPRSPDLTVCEMSWDRRPLLEFSPLPAGVTYELLVVGEALAFATVSLEGQNYFRPREVMGAGGPPPAGERLDVYARACRVGVPDCCVTSAAVTVRLIEACSTPVAPTAANIVFSEYVINGDGPCPGAACEAGEAIEITNLSHCPVALAGHHFGYANASGGAVRWMNFGVSDVIPPRGVYVAIRNRALSSCDYPFFGPDDPGLFGLRISTLSMQGDNLISGWFNNTGGGASVLRIATGAWVSISGGTTLEIISPYSGAASECESIGFNALDECGNISSMSTPNEVLSPNQLGRLWRPCDAVVAPFPADCR